MDLRVKLFLGVAAVLLATLMAVPSRGKRGAANFEVPAAAVPAVLPVTAPTAPVRHVGSPAELLAIQEHTASLSWGRDPFVRPAAPAPAPEPLPEPDPEPVALAELSPEPAPRPPLPSATGVSTGPSGTYAIVDRRVVEVGDLLPHGFRVLRIEPGVVTVEFDGEALPLILGD